MAVIPLKPTTTLESIKKYGAMWACGLCYFVRLLTPHPIKRHGYSMVDEDWWDDDLLPRLKGTHEQRQWVRGVNATLERLTELKDEQWQGSNDEGGESFLRQQETQKWEQRLDKVIPGLSMSVISHPLEGYRFESSLLSYAAARAVAPNGSWMHPFQYTPCLSGMIKSGQLVLMAQALHEHTQTDQDQGYRMSLQEKTEMLVRQWLANDKSTPLAELNLLQLYGQKIARVSLPPFLITWSCDEQMVAYRDKTLHLGRWRALNQGLVRHARILLEKELLLGLSDAPRMPAYKLQDVMTESRPGYHFVNDPRNNLTELQGWLWQHLYASPTYLGRFVKMTNATRERTPRLLWKESTVHQYQQ